MSMLVSTKRLIKLRYSKGILVAFDGDTLTIDYLDKTRKKTVEIPYSTVAKARCSEIVVKFYKLQSDFI